MLKLFGNVILGCLAVGCLCDTTAAQTVSPTKPNTLVPGGTTPGGATRLRLIADPPPSGSASPAPTGSAPPPSFTPPLPPLPAPSGTSKLPPNVPTVPPGAIPPDAGDSSYPPREPILRERQPKAGDPTLPGPAIRELLGQGEQKNTQNPEKPAGLPIVRLRGRVAVRDKPVVALIQIDERIYSVRPGDEFSVDVGGVTTPMKVIKLTATEMQIELVNRRATVNLH